MKTINAIVKVLTALAAIAGAVYIIATYGDQIVAWAKKMLSSAPQVPAQAPVTAPVAEPEKPTDEAECCEAVAEEAAPAEEASSEETVAVPAAEENAPVADESDFEG